VGIVPHPTGATNAFVDTVHTLMWPLIALSEWLSPAPPAAPATEAAPAEAAAAATAPAAAAAEVEARASAAVARARK
jgi:hypothetical protein